MRSPANLSPDEASRLLRDAGLRRSLPRVILLQAIAPLDAPVSHGEMVQKLASHDFDAATIYRCLNDLAEVGILSRMVLGDRTYRFEFRRQGTSAESHEGKHPHFMCVECGRIVCLESRVPLNAQELRQIRERAGEVTEILFKGICHECRKKPRAH